jgi:transposase
MHTEIYTIKGREYKYQVTNYREGNKIKHKKKYVGPVVPVNKTQRRKSTGRKPSAFVRKIAEEERQELEKATKSNNAFTKERAKIILYSAAGMKTSEICKKMQREKRSILEAIKKFNEKGLACLERGKTTGRKPKFTKEQKAKMIETVNTEPRKLGKNFTAWSLPKLKQYFIENKIVEYISVEAVRYILKKGNKRYKKSRKWLYSNDPNFAKKNF